MGTGSAVIGPDFRRYYVFMYAAQTPMEVVLLPLRLATGVSRSVEYGSSSAGVASVPIEHTLI